MPAQFELTPDCAAALARLEKDTGKSRSALLNRALDNLIEQRRGFEELSASVARGRADIVSGRYCSHEEAMSCIRSSLHKRVGGE